MNLYVERKGDTTVVTGKRSPSTIYVEDVTSRIGEHVVASTCREATLDEVERAVARHAESGECEHNLFTDDSGYMYDVRSCAICGRGLGAI